MSKFRRTEVEIDNFKKIVDYKESLGELKDRKNVKSFEIMLKREGFPNLNYFRTL